MTRGPRPSAARGRRTRKPGPSRRRWPWLAAGLAVLVGAAVLVRALRPGRPPAPPDPLAAMPWQTAFRAGDALAARGRLDEALLYYRRATRDQGASEWRTHLSLAIALRNLALVDTVRHGLRGPHLRSSYERTGMGHEALREIEAARGLLRRPDDAGVIARVHGRHWANWGFVWDSFVTYREGQRFDPTGECAMYGDAFLMQMQEPTRR